jgi:DNA-binding NarL/FixJ family response regulator
LNAGAAHLLEKPFRASELIAEARRLLDAPSDVSHAIERALTRAGLTAKEQRVARLLLKGLTTAEIARVEGNSDKTIKQHATAIYAKCGVSTRAELFHHLLPT